MKKTDKNVKIGNKIQEIKYEQIISFALIQADNVVFFLTRQESDNSNQYVLTKTERRKILTCQNRLII